MIFLASAGPTSSCMPGVVPFEDRHPDLASRLAEVDLGAGDRSGVSLAGQGQADVLVAVLEDVHDDRVFLAGEVEDEVLARQLDAIDRNLAGVEEDVVGEEVGQHGEPARTLDAEGRDAGAGVRLDEVLPLLEAKLRGARFGGDVDGERRSTILDEGDFVDGRGRRRHELRAEDRRPRAERVEIDAGAGLADDGEDPAIGENRVAGQRGSRILGERRPAGASGDLRSIVDRDVAGVPDAERLLLSRRGADWLVSSEESEDATCVHGKDSKTRGSLVSTNSFANPVLPRI